VYPTLSATLFVWSYSARFASRSYTIVLLVDEAALNRALQYSCASAICRRIDEYASAHCRNVIPAQRRSNKRQRHFPGLTDNRELAIASDINKVVKITHHRR
jgi:hypothetical protein